MKETDFDKKQRTEKISAIKSLFTPIIKILNEYKLISDIYTNPDGVIWVEAEGKKIKTDLVIDPTHRLAIIKQLAGVYSEIVDTKNPILSVSLPFDFSGRFEGVIPPVVPTAIFAIRFPPKKVYSLDDLLQFGTVNETQYLEIREAVEKKYNIIIGGSTGSGKTTITNSIIQLMGNDRILTVEDEPELKVGSIDWTPMFTTNEVSLRDCIKSAMRLRIERIIVGEIRDGKTAIEALKSFKTGHRGCIATIHADSAEECIDRLLQLLGEVVMNPDIKTVTSSIDMFIYCSKIIMPDGSHRRKVSEIFFPKGKKK